MINKIKNNPFAVNSIILFSGSMLGNVLNYIFHLVVGRMVSVEIYGEVESLVSLITIVSVPAMTLGMIATKYSACSKADNDRRSSHDLMVYLNKKVFIYGIPIFAVAMFATPFFKEFLNISENMPLIIIWLMMFLALLGSINNGILLGWQKFKDASWIGVLGAIVKLISAIILIKLGFVLSGAVGSFAIGALASYIASIFTLRFILREKRAGDQNSIDFRSVKKYVVPALIGNLAISILGNADMVLAKHNLDPLLAGQYGALTIVSKIIFFATGVIATVLFTMSAEGNHRKNNSRAILVQASALMLLVSTVAIAFYFAFPKFILSLLFGNKYSSVALYLGFFAVVVSLFSFVNLFLQYLLSIHRTKIANWLLSIAILEVVFVMFLGKSISAIIALVALIQVLAIITCFVFLFNKKKMGDLNL
jgi:O-antigen/teichoic acid export membrane protein